MDNNSFYSIDRLVEFGMGMAMAQQMVRTMNETMQTMYVPGSPNTITPPASKLMHVAVDGQAVGPIGEKELLQLIENQKINSKSLVWMPGMPAWKMIEEVPEVLRIIALAPPPLPQQ